MTLARLERRLRERVGLEPASLGPKALATAIHGRMKSLPLESQSEYASHALTDEAEWVRLVDALLVPESWFFRGGRPLFDVLAAALVQAAMRTGRPGRALCVPCGHGEEPYSLAIALHDAGVPEATVDGWDLSDSHLAKAREARFSSFSFREMDAAARDRYFKPTKAEEWQLAPEIRSRVRFGHCNLSASLETPSPETFDVVICRNVFIYMTDEARKNALRNLERWLAKDGLLCLSPAEADRLPPRQFERLESTRALLYRRATKLISPPPPPVPRAIPKSSIPSVPRSELKRKSSASRPALPKLNPLDAIRAAADRGDLASALTSCEELLANAKPTAELYGLLGVLYLAQGNSTGAFDAFTRALYLKPDHAESLEHLALLSEERGDRVRAAALRRKLHRTTGGGDA